MIKKKKKKLFSKIAELWAHKSSVLAHWRKFPKKNFLNTGPFLLARRRL